MLDQEHEGFQNRVAQDNNSYMLGRVHEHNVVMACLPAFTSLPSAHDLGGENP